jgi:hypothetical protein
MLCENCKNLLYKRVAILFGLCAVALLLVGAVAASRGRFTGLVGNGRHYLTAGELRSHAPPYSFGARQRQRQAEIRRIRRRHDPKPRTRPRATISIYERTTRRMVFFRQGCRASRRGATGVVILDFGKPAYNGHTYGTILFSGAFAGNKAITRAMLAYASGYSHCLQRGSHDVIQLARGTSNYHPSVPSTFHAGRKWARETMTLQHQLRETHLDAHVVSAAADDVEPAWDRGFRRTRDFYRGYASTRVGHALYNYGSLDGGIVSGIWSVHQAFFVTGGMRYARAIPEIYNKAMAREWAALAQVARRRYHRPLKFAGVMTEHTSSNRGMKPRDAHRALVRELAAQGRGAAPAAVPAAYTNITTDY